jgi:ribosomal protein S18 acetylase RimI-like enzyme
MELRDLALDDYAAAVALWKASEGVGLSAADAQPAMARFLERNPGLSAAAVEGDRLVGTLLCGHDGRRGLIHHLVVDAGHRRRGIGGALVRRALRGLRSVGIDKCHLLVFRDNQDGLHFWRRIGAEERVRLALFSMETLPGSASEVET